MATLPAWLAWLSWPSPKPRVLTPTEMECLRALIAIGGSATDESSFHQTWRNELYALSPTYVRDGTFWSPIIEITLRGRASIAMIDPSGEE